MKLSDACDTSQLETKVFYNTYLPLALRKARDYAGDKGSVLSMPQFLDIRAVSPFNNDIWHHPFLYTALSEENIGRTPGGNDVFIAVHGGGILGSPSRLERSYREGRTLHCAARLDCREIEDLLEGRLSDGTEIPVFPFSEFRKMSGGIGDRPMRYAVVMDMDTARRSGSGICEIDLLYEDVLFISRAGGIEPAAAYLNKLKEVYRTDRYGSWHPFKLKGIDPSQPQGRLLFLGNTNSYGIGGDQDILYYGCFRATAPMLESKK